MSYEIAIIGGGIIGLSIARELALRGVKDICLIERSKLGAEASFAAGGMLAPQAEANSQDAFFELCSASRDLYPNFAASLLEETGIDVQLDQTGTLYLALNEHDQHELDRRYAWQTQANLVVEKLDAIDAGKLEPHISSKVTGALRFPLDMQVDNRQLVTALARSVAKQNVAVLTATSVESVSRESQSFNIRTDCGQIEAATVIVAAGSWTSAIVLPAPVTPPEIRPVRGQMVCFDSKPQLWRHVIYSPRGYLVPRQDGRVLSGSTSEDVGFVKQITAGGMSSILANSLEISPQVSVLPVIDSWAGLRPCSPDGLPVLGACVEIDQLFYATGHYRNGILLAPITGELIADAVVERKSSPLFDHFSAARFELAKMS
jgi:glycine oxidase